MNLAGLPPELTTAAWQAAYAALGFDDPAEEYHRQNIMVQTNTGKAVTVWAAMFRRHWPCCGVYSEVSAVETLGGLDSLARSIPAGLATHDEPCPNADTHASKDRP